MTRQTLIYIDSIAHLPEGGTLVLTDVPWDEYDELVDNLEEFPGARVCYDQGRLEIARSTPWHENFKALISAFGFVLSDETGMALESRGSTTYKQEWLGRGVEPDGCFYIQNANRIIGVSEIDLRRDPPPDIVIEVDISHESAIKLPIYAGMGVPELWRYDGKRAYIYQLLDQAYVEVSTSEAFPMITSDLLSRFLEQNKTEGQTAALKSFREWLQMQTC